MKNFIVLGLIISLLASCASVTEIDGDYNFTGTVKEGFRKGLMN